MKFQGLNPDQAKGQNALTHNPPEPLWKKIFNGFMDPMIMILIAAFIAQLILYGLWEFKIIETEVHWYEPIGILLAILIANGVASISEKKQEGKAFALQAAEEQKEKAKVVRGGMLDEIPVSDVVVGDIVFLQAGDRIAADGLIIEGDLKVDQATLNGETDEADKGSSPHFDMQCENKVDFEIKDIDIKDLLNLHYVYRGTVVTGGEAHMKVKVVGDNTLFGELAREVQEETRQTPLQVKLTKLAKQISTFGYIGAIAIVIGVLATTIFVAKDIPQSLAEWIVLFMTAITVAVTIIVCAVPEGLPMLTSILLSFQSMKMAKDNVLVHKINGLETAGSLSLLFTDKTGTITEGKLSVIEMATGNIVKFQSLEKLPHNFLVEVITGIGTNNSSVPGHHEAVIGGNSTDRALMSFIIDEGVANLMPERDVTTFSPFDSKKKSSSITVKKDEKAFTYIKGAPERIIDRCTHYLDEENNIRELSDKSVLSAYIDTQAGRMMRLLAVAKAEGNSEEAPLTFICIVCIRDDVRQQAPQAIKDVRNAGIQVVMVTGDRKETAVAIAKETGLLASADDIALTSSELGEKTDDEIKKLLPNLRVVSRALPTDKSRLVRLAQELNYVVGMTGDGVNDSPALKKADVGFAMGSGTEVAKEAGDITILDDNFLSIRKAILYGRTMFKSIRKFLIFQLTVNVAAVLTCFIGPLMGVNVVLTVIQLLLINLAMDTLAAIAFGSEPALDEYMQDKPVPRDESIVTKQMMTEVCISAAYVTFICLTILYSAIRKIPLDDLNDKENLLALSVKSSIFATFMLAITFNGFNARTHHLNPFNNFFRNMNFLLIMLSIFALQFIFVMLGGKPLSVQPLDLSAWGLCLFLAILIIPLDVTRKLVQYRPQ